MIEILEGARPRILSVMRIMVGLLFMQHGIDKTFGGIISGRDMTALPTLSAIAGYIELVGGALIALGLLTRIAAVISGGLMAVAYFMGHASGGFFPLKNRGELAVLYCFAFLYLIFSGPGPISLDALFCKRPTDPAE